MSENKTEKAIVKADSAAYGYNYASLADIVKQGFSIPKMRICDTPNGDYIEYLDENGEWQMGAKIVIPEMKGSNAAQAYGSALTYARRYTAQMALALASDDDSKLEKQKPKDKNQTVKSDAPPTEKQLGYIAKLMRDQGQSDALIQVTQRGIQTAGEASRKIKELQGGAR